MKLQLTHNPSSAQNPFTTRKMVDFYVKKLQKLLENEKNINIYIQGKEDLHVLQQLIEKNRDSILPKRHLYDQALSSSDEDLLRIIDKLGNCDDSIQQLFTSIENIISPKLSEYFKLSLAKEYAVEYASINTTFPSPEGIGGKKIEEIISKSLPSSHTSSINISHLDFSIYSPSQIQSFFQHFPDLKSLSFIKVVFSNLSEAQLDALSASTQSLLSLSLHDSGVETTCIGGRVSRLFPIFQRLWNLNITERFYYGDLEIHGGFFSNLNNLRRLNISGINLDQFAPKVLGIMAQNMPYLQALEISYCRISTFSDEKILAFAPIFKTLRTLCLDTSNAQDLSEAHWKIILSHAPHLRKIQCIDRNVKDVLVHRKIKKIVEQYGQNFIYN